MRSNACKLGRLVLVIAMLFFTTISIDAARQGGTGPRSLRSLYEDFSGKRSGVAAQGPRSPAVAALFLEAPQYSIGLLPRAVAAADFNGDGKDDLAVANFCADDKLCGNMDEPSSISILLGNGDGTFKDHVDYLTATGSVSLMVGDFNNDGKTDVAATNICSNPTCSGSSVSVLLGRGDGTLRPHLDYATGPGAVGIAMGDLNGDDKLDLVTADALDAVSVLLGNGDGTFRLNVDYPMSCPDTGSCEPAAVVIADVNGDRKPDLAPADYFGGRVSVFLGNGDGTLQPQSDQGKFLTNPSVIAAEDLNGDGNIDLVVNDQNNNIADAIAVLPGKGDGIFPEKLGYRTGAIGFGEKPCSIAIADFNGDGKWDIANCNHSGNSVTVVIGNGDETFSYPRAWGTGEGPKAITVGDFDGDGKKDIAAVNAIDNTVSVLLGNGDGTFYSRPDADWFAGPIPSVADFNGDGKTDLIVSGGVYARLSVLLGNGNGTFQFRLDLDSGAGPTLTGDFNRDRKPDFAALIWCDSSCPSSFVRVYLGNGDGTFKPPVDYPVPFTALSLASADFNSDGKPDLVVGFGDNLDSPMGLRLFLGNGDGTFGTSGDLPIKAVGNIVTADFNGDGKADLVAADTRSPSFDVLLGNGDGTFRGPVNYLVPHPGSSAAVLAVGDINSDSKPDVVVPGSVFLGIGDGTLGPALDYEPGTSAVWGLAVGDFDGDHHADVAVVDGDTPFVNIVRGNGDGTFNTPSRYITGGASQGLAIADFNDDGKPDLAAPNFFSASVLLNIADIPMFTLSVGINGTGGGSVRVDPGGTQCSANCSKSFATGTAVTLIASANAGSSFKGWSGGACSGTGTCNLTLTSNLTVIATFDLTPDFSLSASDFTPNPIIPGQSSAAKISADAAHGFGDAISLTCSVQPSPTHTPQCSVSPNSIPPGNSATATITTTAPMAAQAMPLGSSSRPFNALWLPLAGLALSGISFRSQRRKSTTFSCYMIGFLLIAGLVFQSACGGGNSNGGGGGTPPGTYSTTITGTSGSLHHSTTVTLRVQ